MSANWYALVVQPRKEEYVRKQLEKKRIRSCAPRYRKVTRHARRTRLVIAPLFPGYIFVEIDLAETNWRRVNSLPGTLGLIKFDGRPAPLNREFIDEMRMGLEADGVMGFHQPLKIGDRVLAVGGPFHRLLGEVIETPTADRIKIIMNALNRKVEMTLPRNAVIQAA